MKSSSSHRPRVLLLADVRYWAFDTIARAAQRHLAGRFDCSVFYRDEHPIIDENAYDIVHVLYESERYHRQFLHGRARVVRSVYSHHWQLDEGLDAWKFYQTYLNDAHAITVPNLKLLETLRCLPPPTFLFAEGVDTNLFRPPARRSGPLVVGWAGGDKPIKRLEWLKHACDGLCELRIADGMLSDQGMVEFYGGIDVIACASKAEGSPRPVLEGMACGCFPVSFDVGIASELIHDGENGRIVRDVSVAGLREAFVWCRDNVGLIRSRWKHNAEIIRSTRSWKGVVEYLGDIYTGVLHRE